MSKGSRPGKQGTTSLERLREYFSDIGNNKHGEVVVFFPLEGKHYFPGLGGSGDGPPADQALINELVAIIEAAALVTNNKHFPFVRIVFVDGSFSKG